MADKPIKEGDLVTISLNEYQLASNTYMVAKKLKDESLVNHPLAPEIHLLKNDIDLNQTFPSTQSGVERSLFFAKKHSNFIGHTMSGDLEALCFFFVVRKEFTQKQRHDLSNICGKIASIILNANVSSAITLIKQNKALLDEYNYSAFTAIKRIVDDPFSVKTKNERYTIFNIAGYVLAQSSVN